MSVSRRVAREIGQASFWLDPELASLRGLLGAGAAQPGDAEVVVVAAEELSEDGAVAGSTPRPGVEPRAGGRIWAVLLEPARIVSRASAPFARVERAFGELGVLVVTPAGLVIVELARGVSALDLQARSEPTLKISPRLSLMER